MSNRRHILFLLFMPFVSHAQDAELPPDFRQHNLTEYNANLFNPIFSLDRNEPRSLALWTRWQWQSIDGDPTTFLFNYTHKLNPNSAGGLGFFQHNTGLYLQTGAIVNYAYNIELGRGVAIAAGLNAFAYQRKPADDIFQPNPDIPLPQFEVSNDFIVQFAPSLRFRYNQFGLGLVGENLLNYNFTNSGQDTQGSNKIYIVHMNYTFPVFIFDTSEDSYIQPTLYIKTLPGLDDQIGIMGLFSTPKFWAQTGYNSFYGLSVGAGGRFFKDFSIGALVEFGSKNTFQDNGTSIEFVTAYNFGEGDIRRRVIGFDEEDEDQLAVVPQEQPTREEEDADEAEAAAIAAREQAGDLSERQRDSIAAVKEREALQLREQRLLDSIAQIRREEALAAARKLREDREKDSLAKVALAEREAAARQAGLEEEVTPEPGEKYEETTTEDGLAPGYYLIANVFGTKKYFEAFMKTLSDKGLQPKSFFRSVNKFNYVYLQRYDTIEAARAARNSKYNGRYPDNLWVFRVVAN